MLAFRTPSDTVRARRLLPVLCLSGESASIQHDSCLELALGVALWYACVARVEEHGRTGSGCEQTCESGERSCSPRCILPTAASCPQDSGCHARRGDETKSVWTASRDWLHLYSRLPLPVVCCPGPESLERPKWPVVSSLWRSKKGRAVGCSCLHDGRHLCHHRSVLARYSLRLLQVTDGQAFPPSTAVPTCP
ncbi:hypothetical protein BKA63DRAFT_514997 [Paraphoma chrysanthemicola]|nr:hypothetical protein BKA63DRAFT_514997 [Paraphoma chrysanthemicola]